MQDPDERDALREACAALPVFPLPGLVFFPHTLLPLHVFEPRYQALVDDVMAGSGFMGVPQRLVQAPGAPARPPLASVFGIGRIVRREALPDGRCAILLSGIGRARRIEEPHVDTPYRIVRSVLLADVAPGSGATAFKRTLDGLRGALGTLIQRKRVSLQPARALLGGTWAPDAFVNALAHLVLDEADARQTFLELDDPQDRAEVLLARLALGADGADA